MTSTEQQRYSLPSETAAAIHKFAEAEGISDTDAVEYWVARGGLMGDKSQEAAQSYTMASAKPAWSQTDYKAALSSVAGLGVVGIRLGAVDRAGKQATPWSRQHAGCEYGEKTLSVLWASARGWFVASRRPLYIVAFRLGEPLGLFGGATWSGPDAENRRWAMTGYAVQAGVRLDPDSQNEVGSASAEDQLVATTVFGHRLVMHSIASNPVVYLT